MSNIIPDLKLPFHTRNRLNAVSNPCSPNRTDMYDTLTLSIWACLLSFVHLCCVGLVSGSTESWLRTSQLCRQHDREYTVCFSLSNPWNVLTTQGSHWFSHTVALFTQALRLAQLFLHTLYFCKFVSYAKFLGAPPAAVLSSPPMRKYSHASNRWISQRACGQLTYISHKFSQVQ